MIRDKRIDLIEFTDAYVDEMGIYHKGVESVSKSNYSSVQPYSQQLLYKDYGFQDNCIKRVFMDVDPSYSIGKTIKYNGQKYKIVRVVEWDRYQELMIDDI